MDDKEKNLAWLAPNVKFPFGVTVKYTNNGNPQGYYTIDKDNGQILRANIIVSGDIEEIDDILVHELQHIHTSWKSGKLYTTDEKRHDQDKNEQIPMTNDIIGKMEHRYRNGESLDSILKDFGETDDKFETARNQKAVVLFKRYLEDYKVVQGVKQTSDNKYFDQVSKLLDLGRSPRDARRYLELRYRSLIKHRGSIIESNKVREAMQKFDKIIEKE